MSLPNLQHSDKWKINFSNFPGFHPSSSTLDNTQLFELYVKEFSFPNMSLDTYPSRFRNFQVNHQISQINDNMSDISITFKVSEGLDNYYQIFSHLESQREGVNVDQEKWFRLNIIKELIVTFLDNEKRPKTKFSFTNCFITDLTSLNLTQGQDIEMTFTITLKYEDYSLTKVEEC